MDRGTLNTTLLAIIAIAAGVMASGSLRRTKPVQSEVDGKYIREWRAIAQPSSAISEGNDQVTIIEFADFQCRFCAEMQDTIAALVSKYPGRIRIVYRHLPLGGHRYAKPAAEASECANEQGVFVGVHNALFDKQDSIGIKSWESFASAGGVQDLKRFSECMASSRYAGRVRLDAEAATRNRITSTPTLLINGRARVGAMTLAELEKDVTEAMRSR